MKSFFRTFLALSDAHWLTRIGVVLTTASAAVFLALVFKRVDNPYFGIVVFVVIPTFFVLGLILMPLGLFLASRRAGGYRTLLAALPSEAPRLRSLGWAFAFATLANAGILAAATYRGVDVMDSKEFCGQTCHSVMQPQYVRYQLSPHASVPCVDCHIGSGAASFVQYKLSGVRQLFRLTTKTYHRPIPPAIERVRPAEEICQACHSVRTAHGNKLRVIRHYEDDEQSTEKITVLLVKVDTIHKAHIGRDIDSPARAGRRLDCMDCHNRAGHDFETAESALDRAMAEGKVDRSRPFAHRDALGALKGQSPIEKQPAAVQQIYTENVYPAMSISWGTYPNNLGHDPSLGCFRCHDGSPITQDCTACHEMLAVSEEKPEILKTLGLQ